MPRRARLFTAPLLLAVTGLALAAEPIQIEIRGQAFTPAEIAVPAGEKLELIIRNSDDLPAEFESYDLSREIVIPSHGQVKVYIGPLEPGRYRFFNDFHQESQGWVVAGGGK
jgi:plastocyanin